MYHIAFHLGWLPPSMMVGNHLYPQQYTRVAARDYRGCCSKFQLFLGKSWVSNKDILNLMEEGYNRANCWFSQLETKKWRSYKMTTKLIIVALRVVIAPRWNATSYFRNGAKRRGEQVCTILSTCVRKNLNTLLRVYITTARSPWRKLIATER